MYDLLIIGKWFCVCFLSVSGVCFWTTGALCLYPGHDINEYVIFGYSAVNVSYTPGTGANDTYPESTHAWYYCDLGNKIYFMYKQCKENGTWTKVWTGRNHRSCAQNLSYRCQRYSIIGDPLTTAQVGSNCLGWYNGINQDTIDNLETECDTGLIESSGTQESETRYYTSEDLKSICAAFWFNTEHDSQTPGGIQFLARTTPGSDKAWLRNLNTTWIGVHTRSSYPKCPFLRCYSDKDPEIDFLDCDFSKRNWVCRYNISSCGTPSRLANTMMTSDSVHIGAVIKYHCQTGYSIVSNNTRVCLNTGLWSGEAPKCEIVDCGPPNNQSSVITYKLVNGTTTVGSSMLCSCIMPADAINGSKYKTCQADGQWHGEEPICQFPASDNSELFGGALEDEEEDLLIKIIGGIASATVFLIALIWLIFAVLLYREKRPVYS